MKRTSLSQKRLLYLLNNNYRYLPIKEIQILISEINRYTLREQQIKGSLSNLLKRDLVSKKEISLLKLQQIIKKYGYKLDKAFSKKKIYSYKITPKGKSYITTLLENLENEAMKLFRLRNSAETKEKQNKYSSKLRAKRTEIRKIKEGW